MLVKQGKILKAKKEVHLTAELHNITEKKIWKLFIRNKLNIIRNLNFTGKRKNQNLVLESIPIKDSLINRYSTFKNAQKAGFFTMYTPFFSIKEENELNQSELLLSILGVYATKQTLAEGIICRDPTRDIRLIEYTLAIPYNQYVCNGSNRNLIRRAMKGKVPDLIRLNYSKRGVQGADWKYLLQIQKFNLAETFSKIVDTKFFNYFLDEEKIIRIAEELNKDNEDNGDNDTIVRSAATLIVAERYFSKVFNNFE
jgi:asparagine synthase (glutamine-hydrolysing)